MENLDLIYYCVLLSVLSLLIIFYGIQSWKKKRTINILLWGMISAFLASCFDIISSSPWEDVVPFPLFTTLQICFYSLTLFIWYIHLERVLSLKVESHRYAIVVFLTALTMISVWFTLFFYETPLVFESLWVIVDLGINLLGLFVFLGMGVYIHRTVYKYSRSRMNLAMLLVYFFIGSSFGFILFSEYCTWLPLQTFADIIGNLGYFFQLIGLLLLMTIYAFHIDRIYQLPFDVYEILIAYKQSGNLINAVSFTSKKQVNCDNHLISSLLTAMNGLFGELFTGRKNIQHIAGTQASLIFEVGQHTIAIIISERISYYLVQSLKNYVKDFELKFKDPLLQQNANQSTFKNIDEILKLDFPYCIRK